jgi:hypothetical protein
MLVVESVLHLGMLQLGSKLEIRIFWFQELSTTKS